MTKITSDGTTASYYQLPEGATELQHLISHRNLNAQDGEIFRAIYRKGRASHSDELRDAKKVLFYAQAEVERLEALQPKPTIVELYGVTSQERAASMAAAWEEGKSAHGEQVGDDGWIEWEGGECPVGPETMVEVETRGVQTGRCMAREYGWGYYLGDGEIIRYRVV